MKKLIWTSLLILFFSISGFSQALLSKTFSPIATGNTDTWGTHGTGVSLHRMQWQGISGVPTACTYILQGSDDQSNWNNITPTITCTSSGSSKYFVSDYGYLRFNVVTLTLGNSRGIQLSWKGYDAPPSPASVYDTDTTPLQILGSISMFGGLNTNITTSTGGYPNNGAWTVSTVAGIFSSLTVSRAASTAGATLTCYDSATTGTTTNKIATFLVSAVGQYFFGKPVSNGISCIGDSWGATNPDITITYQ